MASKWSVSVEDFKDSVLKILQDLKCSNIRSLTEHQERAMLNVIGGKDTFVSLPTGHGKSLIYQLAPPVCRHLGMKDPMLLIISPLNALIDDQIQAAGYLGISACKLESSAGSSDINYEEFSMNELIYCSPEMLESLYARKFIRTIEHRLVAIVVDEPHCIVNW